MINRATIDPNYDFKKIETVRVGNFVSDSLYESSGGVVKNIFIKQLLENGYRVVLDEKADSDVTIEGSLTVFQPDKKYLIYSENNKSGRVNHAPVIYTNNIVEIGGSNVYDLGTAFGFDGTNRVIASNATVGITAYMIDTVTGEIIWSDSYTYEGLDLSSALNGAVRYILKTLPH